MPANVPTKTICPQQSDYTLLILDPAHVAHIAHESVNADKVEIMPRFATPDPLISQIGQLLKSEMESNQVGSRLFVDSLTTTLSVHLLRNYSVWEQNIRDYTRGLAKHKLQQVLDYLDEYLDQEINLVKLASVAGVSRYYFIRLFKRQWA